MSGNTFLEHNASARHSRVVTPSDTVLFPEGPCRRLRVGNVSSGATLVIINLDGSTTEHENVFAGEAFDVQARGVAATDTDVTNIVAYW